MTAGELTCHRSPLAAAWRNVGFFAALVVLVYCLIGAFDPPRLNWGDSGSDYNTMIAGRNFAKYGFASLRFTPHFIDTAVMIEADSGLLYTHYPQLPDLMNGVYRKTFGLTDVVPFRFFALAFSFGGLFFVYQLMLAYWSRQTAQIGLALWVTNPLWIQHADYLHHWPYGAFFGFGSLYFLVRYFRERRPRRLYLASGLFLFLAYCSSYDYWIFTPLLLAAIALDHLGRKRLGEAIGLLAGLAVFAFLAIGAKVATNVWAMGLDRFLHDLHFQSIERSTDDVVRTSWTRGVWPTLIGRTSRHFTLLLIPVVAFWAILPLIRKHLATRLPSLAEMRANPVVVLLAATPFLFVFRELWVAQYYPFLMVVPFYAIGFGALIHLLVQAPSRPAKWIGAIVLAVLVLNGADETLRFKKTFFDRESIRTLRAQLDSLAPAGQWPMTNNLFEAQYRYYFDRNMVPLIVHPSVNLPRVMAHFSDPNDPRFANAQGSLFVQHKHLTDEMFDKGYYYPLARFNLWKQWGNPPKYRDFIDLFIADRDSAMTAVSSGVGKKVYEDDFYILWRLPPSKPLAAPVAPARHFRLH